MLNTFRIDVSDLKRFDAELRSLGGEFEKGLQPVLKSWASGVVPKVQARLSARYPAIAASGRVPVRAGASRSGATIAFGRPGGFPGQSGWVVPFGLEFGSNRRKQFFPWTGRGPRGMGSAGRIFYPTLREEIPDMVDDLGDRILEISARAFPDRIVR